GRQAPALATSATFTAHAPCPAHAPLGRREKEAGAVNAQARARPEAGPGPAVGSATPRRAQRAGASCPPRSESAREVRRRGSFWQQADEPRPARGLVGGLKEVKWRTWRTKRSAGGSSPEGGEDSDREDGNYCPPVKRERTSSLTQFPPSQSETPFRFPQSSRGVFIGRDHVPPHTSHISFRLEPPLIFPRPLGP
uniref:RAN binding protein 3 n=1 Tax=Equus asinus TaxID=9793 RepID=A0A9L0IYJ6_EQUAS